MKSNTAISQTWPPGPLDLPLCSLMLRSRREASSEEEMLTITQRLSNNVTRWGSHRETSRTSAQCQCDTNTIWTRRSQDNPSPCNIWSVGLFSPSIWNLPAWRGDCDTRKASWRLLTFVLNYFRWSYKFIFHFFRLIAGKKSYSECDIPFLLLSRNS